jgi:hypothetical protein
MTTSGNLSDFFSFPDFTNNEPVYVATYPRIEQPSTNGPFAMQVLAYFDPPETANYTFYIASDGQSQLLLSTDATTNNAQVICNQPTYDDVRQWINDRYNAYNPNLTAPIQPLKVSFPVALVAGQQYYLEADYMGPGNQNKNLSVTWTDDGQLFPAPSPLGLLDGTTPQSLGLQPYNGAVNYWRITPTNGIGGTVTPTNTVGVLAGASQTFTITASPGYTIGNVTVDGVSVGAVSSYTFNNVNTIHTISATFNAYVPPAPPSFGPVYVSSGNLVLTTPTQLGYTYNLLQTSNLNPPVVWTTNSTTAGTGGTITNTSAILHGRSKMFYRWQAE